MGIFKLVLAIALTIAPVTELRIGLPLAVNYALGEDVSICWVFGMILLINLITIFFIFLFLDYAHKTFLKLGIYRRGFIWYSKKCTNKLQKFKNKYEKWGFFALILFVAIPLPGTGAWTGSFLSWIIGLDRRKSIISICMGVILAGFFIFLGILGFLNIFY